jgi:hypothetical protein
MSEATPGNIVAALKHARELAVMPHVPGMTREQAAGIISRPSLKDAAELFGLSSTIELIEIMGGRSVTEFFECFRFQADMIASPPEGKTLDGIFSEIAYAQSKFLGHGDLRLSRGIRPSDIDMAIDSNGYFLFTELWRGWAQCDWHSYEKVGQRILYLRIASLSDRVAVVLARHDVPLYNTQILTGKHIADAHVVFRGGMSSAWLDAGEFVTLQEMWSGNPLAALVWLDSLAASQQEATA